MLGSSCGMLAPEPRRPAGVADPRAEPCLFNRFHQARPLSREVAPEPIEIEDAGGKINRVDLVYAG
eukprot:5310017-Heterocapsa_arctica.AAC.1